MSPWCQASVGARAPRRQRPPRSSMPWRPASSPRAKIDDPGVARRRSRPQPLNLPAAFVRERTRPALCTAIGGDAAERLPATAQNHGECASCRRRRRWPETPASRHTRWTRLARDAQQASEVVVFVHAIERRGADETQRAIDHPVASGICVAAGASMPSM
jgi:hypothetical protein